MKRKEIESAPVHRKPDSTEKKESIGQVYQSMRKSRHLLLIVGIVALTMATGTFVDTQFKGVTDQHYMTSKEFANYKKRSQEETKPEVIP